MEHLTTLGDERIRQIDCLICQTQGSTAQDEQPSPPIVFADIESKHRRCNGLWSHSYPGPAAPHEDIPPRSIPGLAGGQQKIPLGRPTAVRHLLLLNYTQVIAVAPHVSEDSLELILASLAYDPHATVYGDRCTGNPLRFLGGGHRCGHHSSDSAS
jgi:hypothetical protein